MIDEDIESRDENRKFAASLIKKAIQELTSEEREEKYLKVFCVEAINRIDDLEYLREVALSFGVPLSCREEIERELILKVDKACG